MTDPDILYRRKMVQEACAVEHFRDIHKVHLLTQNIRAAKDTGYADLLLRFQRRGLQPLDMEVLKGRFEENLCSYERASFKNAVSLFTKKEDVQTENM